MRALSGFYVFLRETAYVPTVCGAFRLRPLLPAAVFESKMIGGNNPLDQSTVGSVSGLSTERGLTASSVPHRDED